MAVNAANQKINVTWRAVIIGLLLIPLNAVWIMQMEAVYYSAHSTLIALFFNVVCNILILILLNIPLRKLSPNLAFNQGELLTVYVMLSLSSALVGHSMLQILPPTMAAPLALATPENDWHDLFWRHIPQWLAISDERALEGYVRGVKKGEPTLYLPRNIEAWLVPVLAWSVFVVLLMFVMLCINIIIRKQWTDREKLTYPIAQLPFEMTKSGTKLFSSKLFWLSFSIVGLIGIVNGLSFFFPNVPYLRNAPPFDLAVYFTTKPWNALGKTALLIRPFILGLVFLIPLDIAFSCWFFFFFWKAQLISASALGWRERPEFPEQSMGAYIALFGIAFWMGRRHLIRFLKSAWNADLRANVNEDVTEPLRYRTAVIGLILGFAFLTVFCWYAGMSMWAAAVFFALFLMTEIGITRIRAEVGSPIHDLHFAGPEYLMVDAVGTRKLGASSLTVMSFFWFLTRAHYSDVMPHQLEGFKLADRAHMKQRGILIAMLVAIIFGTIVAFWAILDASYRFGSAWSGSEPFLRLSGWLTYSKSTDFAGIGFFTYGLLFGLFLMAMRLRFIWWPFHPAGYAVSSTYGMRGLWSMFFLAWLVKLLVLKHGGLRLHRRILPLFYGMILGDFVVGGFWALFGVVFQTPTYNFLKWW